MTPIEIWRLRWPDYSNIYERDVDFLQELVFHGFLTEQQMDMALNPPPPPEFEPELTTGDRISLGLFRRVAGFFVAMWDGVWDAGLNATQRLWIIVADNIREPYNTFLTRLVQDKLEDEKFVEFLPPTVRTKAIRFKNNPNFTDAIALQFYGLFFVLGFLISFIPVISADSKRKLNKLYSPEIPDISSLIKYDFRFPNLQDNIKDRASQLGFDGTEFDILKAANRPILEVSFIKDLSLRSILTDEQTIDALKQIGYSTYLAKQIKELFYYIPSPPDQVRFAVREAFYPEYVKKYGLDNEYPQDFEDAVKKTGVSPEWARMYWRSHWELPSLQMGFEMLHRGVIDSDTLDDLFKAADIMPYWREQLKDISFNPLTRVDVRRMHKIGVLGYDEVYKAYRDVGYNDDNAKLMTEFTILYNQESERDLTKADILAAYKRRLLTKDETSQFLSAMGYDKEELTVLIDRIDYDLELSRKKIVLANLKKGYIRGIYTEVTLAERFGELDMVATEGRELIKLWDTEKKDQSRSLTRTDLDKMFKGMVFDKETYVAELKLLNYSDRDIDLLVKLNTAVKK